MEDSGARAGRKVTLFEAAPEIRAQGAGFVLHPGGQRVLRALGLWDSVCARAEPLDRIFGRDLTDGRVALDVRTDNPRLKGLAVERAGLVAALLDAARAAGVDVRTGRRAVSASGGTLHFADGGSEGAWEGVVDASGGGGMASPMKARMLPYGAFWATVPWTDGVDGVANRQLTQRYAGTRRMVGILPLGTNAGGEKLAAFFWSVRMKDADAIMARGFDAWKRECLDFWPEIAPFVEGLSGWNGLRLAVYSHGRLRRPAEPGLVRIGDAAHRTSPQLGQGANMALLDAMALSDRLASERDWNAAARGMIWDRRLHVAFYHAASGLFTPQYQSDANWLAWWRNRVFAPLGKTPPAKFFLPRLVAGSW